LLYAAKVFPIIPPPEVDDDRRGNRRDNDEWEIEDATGYNAIWLYSLLGYVSDVRQDESLYRSPTMQYYMEYYLQMMCPAGVVPDVGDANWGSGWDRFIPFFEKAASVNRDPRLRWAAARMFRKYCDPLPARRSVFLGLTMSERTAGDFASAAPIKGAARSLTISEEVCIPQRVGRQQHIYALNTGEGDGGCLFREYLRTSIPVEEG
jgi:hypothetical protein